MTFLILLAAIVLANSLVLSRSVIKGQGWMVLYHFATLLILLSLLSIKIGEHFTVGSLSAAL